MRPLYKTLGIVIAVFFTVVFVTATFSFIWKVWFRSPSFSRGHVTVIEISGVIVDAQEKLRELEAIADNSSTKALVVRVNSPGGFVAPSQELYQALVKMDEKIPVVISMGPVAASGGYYISLGGRKIFANPGTLTASIGVISEFVNTQKLYQWAKVERYSITAGRLKSMGSPFRPMTAEEKAVITSLLQNIHGQFKDAVKARRKLTADEVNSVSEGQVMTGAQALSAKLIDSLGGLPEAVEEAKRLAKLKTDAATDYIEPDKGVLRKWLLGDSSALKDVLPKNLSAGGLPVEDLARQVAAHFIQPGWQILLLAPVR